MKQELTEIMNNMLNYVEENIKQLDNDELRSCDDILRTFNSMNYLNTYGMWSSYDTRLNKLFNTERTARGADNYHKVKLSENSIGLYRLKRDMSFHKSSGTVVACKGVMIELAKRNDDKYDVRLVRNPYADVPVVEPLIRSTITKKQIGYYCCNPSVSV